MSRVHRSPDGKLWLFADGMNEPAPLTETEADAAVAQGAEYTHSDVGADHVTFTLSVESVRALAVAWETLDDDVFAAQATALIRDVFHGRDGHLAMIDNAIGCPS